MPAVTLCLVDREMTKKFALSWVAHVRAVTELKKQTHTGGEDLGQAESRAILVRLTDAGSISWQYAQERKRRVHFRGAATSCLHNQSR